LTVMRLLYSLYLIGGKKMPSKGWGKNTEALNAVQDCVIRRLSTEESLEYLEAKGRLLLISKDSIKKGGCRK